MPPRRLRCASRAPFAPGMHPASSRSLAHAAAPGNCPSAAWPVDSRRLRSVHRHSPLGRTRRGDWSARCSTLHTPQLSWTSSHPPRAVYGHWERSSGRRLTTPRTRWYAVSWALGYRLLESSEREAREDYGGPFAPMTEMRDPILIFPPYLLDLPNHDEVVAAWLDVADSVQSPAVAARLCDLVWCTHTGSERYRHARRAIESYLTG